MRIVFVVNVSAGTGGDFLVRAQFTRAVSGIPIRPSSIAPSPTNDPVRLVAAMMSRTKGTCASKRSDYCECEAHGRLLPFASAHPEW